MQFGERVPGYDIRVLNEREIRAAAGLLFVLMFTAIQRAAAQGDFTLLKYAVVIFLADMLVRVLVHPRYAPMLIVGRLLVRKQTPEYVGAKQKMFAWLIGLLLGSVMLALAVIANTSGPITGIVCFICLMFLFCEAALGICIGCKVYGWIYGEKAQHCPGEVCELKDRQEITKTSWLQLVIVVGFVGYIALTVALFRDFFAQPPTAFLVPSDLHQPHHKPAE